MCTFNELQINNFAIVNISSIWRQNCHFSKNFVRQWWMGDYLEWLTGCLLFEKLGRNTKSSRVCLRRMRNSLENNSFSLNFFISFYFFLFLKLLKNQMHSQEMPRFIVWRGEWIACRTSLKMRLAKQLLRLMFAIARSSTQGIGPTYIFSALYREDRWDK